MKENCFSITEAIFKIRFRELITVYSENYMIHERKLGGGAAEF